MREYKIVKCRKTIKTEELIKVVCNYCKLVIYIEGYSDHLPAHNFLIYNHFGHKNDGYTHHFDLCDDCYCKLIKKFKVPVINLPADFV